MSSLRRQWIIRHAQNPTVVLFGRFLLPFSTTNIPESDLSSLLTHPVNCPSPEMVDYLTNSFGLPSEAVTGICRRLGSRARVHKARRVIDFFRESGFKDADIKKAIKRNPRLLGARLEKTVMPRVRAFLVWGLSSVDIGRLFATNPSVLNVSFEKKIVPIVSQLRSLLPDNEKAVGSIKRFFYCSFLGQGVEERISINVAALRRHAVPDRSLSIILVACPSLLGLRPSSVEKMIVKVNELGIDQLSPTFPYALYTVSSMAESVWNGKLEVLKGFGWTQEDILLAFHKCPLFLTISAVNLKRKLDFLVEELGYHPSKIAPFPSMFLYSMERRIKPRLSVLRILDSNKLVSRKKTVLTLLHMKDEEFYQEFVLKHKDKCPEVVEAYSTTTNGDSDA
ncbi:hypothetical protein EJ110_NYTH55615 [Nymphaea thermarum]|nr:hypothetical protein EJ110_NYTH55615 [Nymphaea thermarum]